MNPNITIHGVHKVRCKQPCYLIELSVKNNGQEFKLSDIYFEAIIPPYGKRDQAPFEEHYISDDGEEILGDYRYEWDNPEVLKGNFRLAFLMHYLEFDKPLKTQFGDVNLPEPTPTPKRLKSIKYQSPY